MKMTDKGRKLDVISHVYIHTYMHTYINSCIHTCIQDITDPSKILYLMYVCIYTHIHINTEK